MSISRTLLPSFLRSVLLCSSAAIAASWAPTAAAKSDVGVELHADNGPELNPFECYGRYESATGNRTMDQIRIELEKKLSQLDPKEPGTVQAMKACVIGRLKARLGDSDADEWYEKAIEEDPAEPGYELFYAMYWSEMRGAGRPVLEQAEKHFYAALDKLEALERESRRREHHDIVEDWTQKKLLVLYQQDGQSLLPWKAHSQNSSGLNAPGLSVSAELLASMDTRDFYYNNEMRTFTGEVLFAESNVRAGSVPDTVRAGGKLTAREKWDLARAPQRLEWATKLRLRQNLIGAIDVEYRDHLAKEAQIESFYWPTQSLVDVKVKQLSAGFQRVFPLYPLFDLRLAGEVRRIERTGVVEFEPERVEEFNAFELRPSISRFVGSDKIQLDGVYAKMDIEDLPGGIPEQAMRDKVIRAVRLTYAFYSPMTLLSYSHGSVLPYRTPTRGLYLYAGAMQDDETYGIRRVTKNDYYAGVRFGTPVKWDLTAQGTYYTSYTAFVDPNDPTSALRSDPTQSYSSVRATGVVQYRIVDPEARPGLNGATGFDLDMANLVFPVHFDKALTGIKDYENIRGGVELWAKLFSLSTWGTPVLVTAGYDAQYFYNMQKLMHLGRINLRLGWGDL